MSRASSATPGVDERFSGAGLSIRRGFFRMSLREKVLALLFVAALVGLWFTWQLGRHLQVFESIGAAHRESRSQVEFMAYGPQVQQDFDRMISEINLEELPTREEVSGRVDALLRRMGFSDFNLGQARTVAGSPISFHSINLDVRRVEYGQIRRFTRELKQELPYVSLERITIRVQPGNDQFLDVGYILKALEYTK